MPALEEKVVEDRGDYEVIQDRDGRKVLMFKGRRSGFTPEYLDHPVKDMRSWVETCKLRMDPDSKERYISLRQDVEIARKSASEGELICQSLVGGYMYLRSSIGPSELLYRFYDEPELIHDCMETWLRLADRMIAVVDEHLTLDELFFAEDIC